ncbi:MAG: YbaK/EbsC family protein [Halobacteriales archaeon]
MHPRAAEFVECARQQHGVDVEVREFPEGTKTAADAAEALDCSVAQIASSIVFTVDGDATAVDAERTDLAVVITSGANRVGESALADLLGADPNAVSPADPDRIDETLGWSIGGVPPFCHETDVPTFLDRTLLGFDTVWAAAGTPEAVFAVSPEQLLSINSVKRAGVAE